MKTILLSLICSIGLFYISSGQIQDTILRQQLFVKGIYLENLHLTIPWKINFSEIDKYGTPKFSKNPKFRNQTLIIWDSVNILNGITVNLQTSRPNKYFKQNNIFRLNSFTSKIDTSTSEKIISYFENLTNSKGSLHKKRRGFTHLWIINKCFASVIYYRSKGYYFHIENHGAVQ